MCGILLGGYLYHLVSKPAPTVQQLSLEQILSIKELHLVKHTYHDLFFLHKKNDETKAIRAIVHVPVEITAYLNLKEINVVYEHDSIKQVVLPHAYLHAPQYKLDQLVVRETRSFQIYAGKDLYPLVGNCMGALIAERMDTVRSMAVANRILVQAEAEGKTYIENLLKSVGRADIKVTFGNEATDTQVITYLAESAISSDSKRADSRTRIDEISFGFMPINK